MFLSDLLILLVFVWLGRKLFQVFGLPSLFGEVAAGIFAGPLFLGWVQDTEAIEVLAELGIFFLMFHAGLEFNPDDLFKASKRAIFVCLGNIFVSTLAAILLAHWFQLGLESGIALGLILSITAVTISTRLFKDNKMMRSRVAHTVIAAAVMTEVIILASFSIFLDLSQATEFDALSIGIDLLKIIAYFGAVLFVGHKCFNQLYKIIYKGNKGFTFSVILALAFSVVAEAIGLHFIIGAFLAGLFIHSELFDEKVFNKIEDRSFGISYSFLAPVFFASLAFHLDFSIFASSPWLIFVLFVVALGAKFLGSGVAAKLSGMNMHESMGVGLGMNSRGAVDLIVATIALEAGVIGNKVFSVIVIVAFITTLVSTMGLKWMHRRGLN